MNEFHTFTLPNGIRCIHKKVKSTVTHCALTVNTGSRDEKISEHGMAHLVEHCLFKGTTKRRAYQVNSRLENLGGELNAFTTKEDTTIHATTLKGDFTKAVELISDVIFNSTFPEHEVEREKQVIDDEINSYLDIPQELLYDDFEARMFNGVALCRNILGTNHSLEKFNAGMIREFVERTYTPDQMVFSAIGNMSESSFEAVCEKYFGSVASRERMFRRPTPPDARVFRAEVTRGTTHQAHHIMGKRAYSIVDERRLPLSLLINILGGPAANSRLNVELRERNGLSYGVDAGYMAFSDVGAAYVYFGCEKKNLLRCKEMVMTEIDRIMQSPLTERQLAAAKKQYIGQCTIATESNESYMLAAAKNILVNGRIESPDEIARRINSVTSEELQAIAQDVFGGKISALTYF